MDCSATVQLVDGTLDLRGVLRQSRIERQRECLGLGVCQRRIHGDDWFHTGPRLTFPVDRRHRRTQRFLRRLADVWNVRPDLDERRPANVDAEQWSARFTDCDVHAPAHQPDDALAEAGPSHETPSPVVGVDRAWLNTLWA